MNMEVDANVMEKINAIWLTPYGVSAKFIFIGGVLHINPLQDLSSILEPLSVF